jgi:hypothetical protein
LCGQQAELGVVDERKEVLDLLLESHFLLVLRDIGIRRLGARVGVAEA